MRIERQVLFWLLALLALILLIGLLQNILLPFVAGMAIAYFLNPAVDRLSSWGVNRVVASVMVVGIGGVIIVSLLIMLLPLLVNQAQQFAIALPGEVDRLKGLTESWARERLGSYFPQFEEGLTRATRTLTDDWASLAGKAAASIWQRGLAVVNFLSLLLVTPLVVFYLLVDWHPMLARIDGWLPRDHAPKIRRLAGEINGAVSAFIRGQGTVCLILGVFYAAALSAAGLKYGLLVGIATGLMAFVPFIGWALGLLTASGLAVVQYWPDMMPLLIVIGIYLAGQGLDAGFLSPNIVGSRIGLHPVWLIFALFSFTYLFGIVGTLVAVPLAAAIAVLVRFALDVYLSSSVYRGSEGA